MDVKILDSTNYWEIVVEVGNDWGEPSYTETRTYDNEEDFKKALNNIGYYEVVKKIRNVTEFNFEYLENDEYLF